MTIERYTKFGRVVRLERDLRRTAIVTVDESGQSLLDEQLFEARPIDERVELPQAHPETVEAVAARIAAMLHPPVVIERLLITHGIASHRFEQGDERNEWQEEAARIHIALAHPLRGVRALLDLGGVSFEELDLREIRDAVEGLASLSAAAVGPGPLRFAPNVAAALWAAMSTFAPCAIEGSFSLHQSSGVDGRGRAVSDLPIVAVGASPPANVFRPSYRARPVVMPFHVRAEGSCSAGEADGGEAIALLAPIAIRDRSIEMSVLVRRGEHSRALQIRKTVSEWAAAVTAIDRSARWYPMSAGAFGAWTVLE